MVEHKTSRLFFLLIFSCFVFGGDISLIAMGELSILFQDDFSQLNLYDFAKMPAGFLEDGSPSMFAIRASGLKEEWRLDSLVQTTYTAIGQAIPAILNDYVPTEAISFYEEIPQFSLIPCEFIYTSKTAGDTYSEFGELIKPQAWGLSGGYSQLSRGYPGIDSVDMVKTYAGTLIYSRPLSSNFDWGVIADGFYGRYNAMDGLEKATLMPVGGSGGISFGNNIVSLGANLEYYYPNFRYESGSPGNEFTEEFSGHAISPSCAGIIDFKNGVWANLLTYKLVTLNGVADTARIGTLKLKAFSNKTQVLLKHAFLRVAVALAYETKTPLFIESNNDTVFNTNYTSIVTVQGLGIETPPIKLGVEATYANRTTTSYLDDDMALSEPSREYILRLGGEYELFNGFFWRCGYNFDQINQANDGYGYEDKVISHKIASGLGLNLNKKFRIDIAYNYKTTKFISPMVINEQKTTDHVFFLDMIFYR